jgi:hypothetical protein
MLEMLPIAEKLAADQRYEPIFFIFREISENNIRLLHEVGIRVIGPREKAQLNSDDLANEVSPTITAEDKARLVHRVIKTITKFVLSWFTVSYIWYLIKLKRQLTHAKRVIHSENIAAVLVMGDRHVGWETALIKAANDRNLLTIIVPFGMSDPKSDVEIRLRLPDVKQYMVSTLIEKLVGRVYPNWVKESGEHQMFFVPVGNALAAKTLGLMPDLPWTIGGGAAHRMAVESPKVLKTFLEEGIPLEKMVVTGKPSMDQIFERMQVSEKSGLTQELGISKGQKIILCSVPQLAEHKLLSWSEHWQEIEFLFSTLTKQQGVKVVLSLHPQSNPEDYQTLADQYGAVIARRRIYDLIPNCDFLVATYSSVVVQAIGCGKPTIVVDFYGLDYTYYDDEPGVVVIKQRETLAPEVNRMICDREYYDQMVEAQIQRGPEWVLLDGMCTDRVVEELYKMIGE